jgi:hypothetical protein
MGAIKPIEGIEAILLAATKSALDELVWKGSCSGSLIQARTEAFHHRRLRFRREAGPGGATRWSFDIFAASSR